MRYRDLPGARVDLSIEVMEQVEIVVKYAGYIQRQEAEAIRFRSLEDREIPRAFDYQSVPSLRIEARQKLTKIRPQTLGQAARISGVTPSDIGLVMVWLKREASESSKQTAADDECGCGD